MKRLFDKYSNKLGEDFIIETDFSSNSTLWNSDILITDWSTMAQEFSLGTKKPTLFINTPMKVMNPNYQKIPCIPVEITFRDELGVSLDIEDLKEAGNAIINLLENTGMWKKGILRILNEEMFDVGHGGKSAGEYIIARVQEIEYLRMFPEYAAPAGGMAV
jgi:YidC/Oxa1 family membrane protein insertase